MAKSQVLQIRLTDAEKQGFQEAADLAGIALSSWVRERLRLAAIRDSGECRAYDPLRRANPLTET